MAKMSRLPLRVKVKSRNVKQMPVPSSPAFGAQVNPWNIPIPKAKGKLMSSDEYIKMLKRTDLV